MEQVYGTISGLTSLVFKIQKLGSPANSSVGQILMCDRYGELETRWEVNVVVVIVVVVVVVVVVVAVVVGVIMMMMMTTMIVMPVKSNNNNNDDDDDDFYVLAIKL
ncbi:hypothetical protein ElyMa_005500400 [Elysia marginata]|uniref:Uncharacterized protein n=1 Tax=Elysia marginata TaxID=1093978 RepID=A0AAV4EUE5_9GAST|nr:hypothetical protein ElyMa_005500400 [Elysia marginata]